MDDDGVSLTAAVLASVSNLLVYDVLLVIVMHVVYTAMAVVLQRSVRSCWFSTMPHTDSDRRQRHAAN